MASARRCAPTSPNTAGSERSTGSAACARRSFSSSWLAGAVMRVQSRPASVSARACPSMSAWIAASVRCLGFSVIPWRRSTACACASVVRHASRSFGIDGLVARQPDQRPRAEVLERSSPVREAALQLARRVGASRLTDESVAFCALAVEMSAPGGQAQLPPGVCGRGRRRGAVGVVRDRSYRLLSRGCARRPNNDAVVANGLGYGRLARRGFRGRCERCQAGAHVGDQLVADAHQRKPEQVLTAVAAV